MVRYQVILAYDGTGFCGFQRQKELRTVQSVVEAALKQLGWEGQSILAAGRTDTGVHALGQVIAFDLDWAHSPLDLQKALNANLPVDVAARAVRFVSADFHPRYDATSRCYQYQVFCQETRDPLRERYAWRVWPPVEISLLQSAAQSLVGVHDFAAFGTPPRSGGSTIRNVSRAMWMVGGLEQGFGLTFEVAADAFLYRMVRRMVYVQVVIGQGRLPLDAICGYLQSDSRASVRGIAPPQGLILVEVVYPNQSV